MKEMRLLQFSGSGIRGYQNYNISFKDSVTFLIGINGSGKTTALKLMQGLLLPSYRLLDQIEYSDIELKMEIDSDHKKVSISSSKDESTITISYQVNDNVVTYASPRFKKIAGQDIMHSEDYQAFCQNFNNQDVCQEISKLRTPQLISLERRPAFHPSNIYQRPIYARRAEESNPNIDECLRLIQESIYDFCRNNIRKQDQITTKFRNNLVKTSLRFNSDVVPTHLPIGNTTEELDNLAQRESDFLSAISGLGMDDIKDEAQDYFKKLKQALFDMNNGVDADNNQEIKAKATVNWFFNIAQLSKVDEIIANGHDYQKQIERTTEPIRRFEDSVNLFFQECNKRLRVSKDGSIKVLYFAHSVSIPVKIGFLSELSSGEKQIVALFGSLIFLNTKNTNVFFIDEPEISLHLSWQDIFVDALLNACPDYQFVLATHSPNIIAHPERQTWCEDLSPKKI